MTKDSAGDSAGHRRRLHDAPRLGVEVNPPKTI
jgi:hypothetical protein